MTEQREHYDQEADTAEQAMARRGQGGWTSDDVADAVDRLRVASGHDNDMVIVSPVDLRMLFASADGVADAYSTVLSHICNLSKPTTDPDVAITMADDAESERFREYLADETATLEARIARLERIEAAARNAVNAIDADEPDGSEGKAWYWRQRWEALSALRDALDDAEDGRDATTGIR